MKRFTSVLLALVLALAMFATPVYAADGGNAAVSDDSGRVGETVYLNVSLSGVADADSVGVKLQVPAELEFVPSASQWLVTADTELKDISAGKAVIALAKVQDLTGNVLKLAFKIKNTAMPGATYAVSCAVEVKAHGSTVYTGTVSGNVWVNPFTDIVKGSYYYPAVQWAVQNNITKGTKADLFGTNDPCTRAQIVTFLWKAAGSPTPKTTVSPFTDVTSGYYYKATLWASENNIVAGYADGTFRPNDTCTRAQIVAFQWRAAGRPEPKSNVTMSDVAANSYYTKAVLWANENSIVAGYTDGTFRPTAPCTRAQIVTFLYRMIVKQGIDISANWSAGQVPVR